MARLHMRIMTASSSEYHLDHAGEHLRLWRDGDQLQDHVSHAAMGLLMALTLRELT